MKQSPIKRQKISNNVVFASYYLKDFNFETARKKIQPPDLVQSHILADFKTLGDAYQNVKKDKPWPFVLPYMYGHITQNSTVFKGPGYYNYVLGYDNKDKSKLVFRLGYFDQARAEAGLLQAQKNKSKSSAQTVIGIKHMQLGSIDLDIVFAGVLIIKDKSAMISPMSGTWLDIMQKYITKQPAVPNCEKKDLVNALNIMNIICTAYAIDTLGNKQPNDVIMQTCCGGETSYKCKYTKASCKADQVKVCESLPMKFPQLTPDLKCMNARLNDETEPFECFHDIPEIIEFRKNPSAYIK